MPHRGPRDRRRGINHDRWRPRRDPRAYVTLDFLGASPLPAMKMFSAIASPNGTPPDVLVEIGRTVVLSDEGVEDPVHTEEHSALAVLHDHVPEAPFELARVLRAHRAEIVAARTIQLFPLAIATRRTIWL